MQNLKNVKLPSASVISGVVQTVLYGSVGVYGLYNGLFNVEGGHRAIVYNRVSGVKQKVRRDRRIGSRGGRASLLRAAWRRRSRFARASRCRDGTRAEAIASTARVRASRRARRFRGIHSAPNSQIFRNRVRRAAPPRA